MGIGCKRIVIRPEPFEASAVKRGEARALEASALIAESALQELVMIGQATQGQSVRRPQDALALPDIGSGRWGRAHNRISGTRPTAAGSSVCRGDSLFYAAKEGIVIARKRFELRITDEDRQRLRAVAEQQAQTESAAIRALIREAHNRVGDENREGKEEAVAA